MSSAISNQKIPIRQVFINTEMLLSKRGTLTVISEQERNDHKQVQPSVLQSPTRSTRLSKWLKIPHGI